MFITLEGPEGSGKTSHIPHLVKYLRGKGYVVFPTREPGGTSISEQIRDILHDLKNTEMHPRTETLLYQAARAQIVEQVIKPRLAAGEIVISDRYYDSTIAYQGYGHQQDLDQVRALVKYATGGLTPDLTILLDLDVEVDVDRLVGHGQLHRRGTGLAEQTQAQGCEEAVRAHGATPLTLGGHAGASVAESVAG